MNFLKTYILLLSLSCTQFVFAQVERSTKSRGFNVPHVSGKKAKVVCPIFKESKYPYYGIGFKAGDPLAITYKLYYSKRWAFAVDAGQTSSALYKRYYTGLFNSFAKRDTLSINPLSGQKSTLTYYTHTVTRDLFFEAKFLRHWDASNISSGLMWYTGAGLQYRYTTLRYEYDYQQAGAFGISNLGNFTKTVSTIGPVLIAGFEYAYFSIPLSLFMEVEFYIDALANPGYHRFQAGTGLRYVF